MQKEKVEELVDWGSLNGTQASRKMPLKSLPHCKSIFVLKHLPSRKVSLGKFQVLIGIEESKYSTFPSAGRFNSDEG